MTAAGGVAGDVLASPVLARGGGDEGSDLLAHLVADAAIKGVIVLVALIVLGLGMVLIWKRVGRGGGPRRDERSHCGERSHRDER
ncbi:hypothetical protein RM550_13215 [Streptomyces sp. DSM 41527]|uniref:Uncharacterized protein n=1 Tax=Streptomyces mooreae TaxID=3075523 RepID=A0ABU2T640_9ACTN|nr:hypothetical protein [Streptomyces sp. DSM 41527]MDT0456684.1 hypothetical protein [Streptomyces sp. DSM 41527]